MAYREEGTITLKLLAQDLASGKIGAFVGHLDKLAMKGGLVGSVAQGVGQSFGQLLNPVGLVTSAVGTLTDFLGDAVSMAMEEEAGIKRLTTAITENDAAWDGNIDAVEKVIDSRQRLAFADDEQRDSLAGLVSVTKDVTKALELQRTAMDLARLRGMDLRTATDLIGKVYAGNLGTLSRYGIVLRKGATATEALAEIQKRASGQAEAYANTTAGAMESLQVELANLQEDIGKELLPVMRDLAIFARDDLVPALKDVIGVVKGLGDYSDELGTILNIVTLNVGAQNAAIEDYMATLDPWVRTFHDLGEELGYSRVQLFRLAQEFHRGGKTVQDFGAYLGSLRKEKPEDILPTPGEVADAASALPDMTRVAVRQTERSLESLVGISRTTLKDTRAEIRDRMKDIKDALEHPFRDDKLEKTYQTAIKNATKRMNKALREGNEEAYAEASQFVEDYKAKLRELRMQRFRVRVSMFVDDSGVTGPGATLLGGLAGSAWGHKPARRARGGPVTAGQAYVVGEERAEVFVPNQSGTIVPSTKGFGAPFVYAPLYSTASPAEAERFAREVTPHIQRAMSRQF
ncbi:MAG: hypothetical protein IT189_00355 [Microbacteriaceae bacterium]|nr:hypothetical protein [Microbacteriaceae bacterium]